MGNGDMELKPIRLSEVSELEPRVIERLDHVEEGLCLVENQLTIADGGRPDVLAVDEDGSLVVLELKAEAADINAVDQGLRYVEWLEDNIELVARAYPKVNPTGEIRLLIIAPAFHDNLHRLVRHIGMDVGVIRVQALRDVETGEIDVLFHREPRRRRRSKSALLSVDDIANYIVDRGVREAFDAIRAELISLDVELRPHKGGRGHWIECTYAGEDIGYLRTRQRYILCQYYDGEAEEYIRPPVRVRTVEDWAEGAKPHFLAYVEADDDR